MPLALYWIPLTIITPPLPGTHSQELLEQAGPNLESVEKERYRYARQQLKLCDTYFVSGYKYDWEMGGVVSPKLHKAMHPCAIYNDPKRQQEIENFWLCLAEKNSVCFVVLFIPQERR